MPSILFVGILFNVILVPYNVVLFNIFVWICLFCAISVAVYALLYSFLRFCVSFHGIFVESVNQIIDG
jgi:hypothetical protein